MAGKNINLNLRLKGAAKTKKGLGGVDSSLKSLGLQAAIAAGAFIALKKSFNFAIELKNFARDAEETTNKFKTVFSSMTTVATRTAKTLADSFGMAHTTAMELLGDTGDILVGFGFTEKSALELSKKVNELSVDLASFTNFAGGAAGASKALTKAILGETESAKSLGIVLRQGTKEFKDSVKVLQETEGMTFNQAMATTLLNDAYKQSTKAIGDFSRTQDQLANQERILAERFKELKEELGKELIPVFKELTSTAMDFVESINLKTMQDFARSVTGIAIAFAAYSSAALLAKVRTIQFQATLIKTGWGALLVGAGLAIGKMMELAGVFSTTEGTIAGLNDEMKELGERTFLLLDPSEQKEKILETKNELLSMFEEGSMGASAFQSFLKNVATKINSLGLTASEAERIYTAALKAGVIERIGAKSEENAEYDAFVQKQRESIDQSEKEIEFIEKLKEQYPELAEAMGLVVKKTDDANDGWETFKKNLDVAAAASILTASSITSTSDALGAAEEAAKRAATAFISAEIQKAVSKWIASMLESSGPLAWLTAPLALAGGAAFGSLMGSAIERISFAQGGDFVTSGPQSILVGDNPGGRERVSVEPLSSPNINGPKGGITLNISAPLVDETVIDHIIPAIEKAQRNNLA